MQTEHVTDTSTPAASTRSLLCDGARRSARKSFLPLGTVMALGTIGGAQDCMPDLMPTADYAAMSGENVGGSLGVTDFPLAVDTPLPSPETDDGIPYELKSHLDTVRKEMLATLAVESVEDVAYPEGRLVPPAAKEHRIHVRFRFIGKEHARISSDVENG